MKKRLTLYHFSELQTVEDYQAITTIRINNYYSIDNFGPLLKRCVNLEELHLIRGFLQPEPPLFIENFPQLNTLVLQDIPIDPLLSLLEKLPQLRRLELKKQHFTSFPNTLLQLSTLEELSLQGSKIETTVDWATLQQLTRLRHLNLYQVNLPKQPAIPTGLDQLTSLQELLVIKRIHTQLRKKSPDFCNQIPYLYSHSALEKKYYATLLNSCRLHKWDWDYRAVLMNLLAQQKDKLTLLAQPQWVLAATDILQLEPLRLQALEYYQERWGCDITARLTNNKCLAVQGNLSIDKRLLRRQLKEQGIRYQAKLTPDTALLLLGQRAQGSYQQALEWNIPIVTEKALVHHLAQQETAYLTHDDEADNNWEQLEMLLCSGQEENIQIALTLFEQGGFPPSLLTALFWAHQLVEGRKINRAIERLLGQHASVRLLEYIKNKRLIFSPYGYEASIKRRLKQLEKYTELNVPQLAKYGYQRYSKGLFYLLTALPQKEGLQLLEQQLSADQTLTLSNNDLTTVPPVVFQLSTIRTLDLSYNNRLKTIATKGLKQLPHLEKLLLYGNSKLRNNSQWVLQIAEQLPDLQVHYYNLPH